MYTGLRVQFLQFQGLFFFKKIVMQFCIVLTQKFWHYGAHGVQ
jgi:hypothetical protein